MPENTSMPRGGLIPVLTYPNVTQATTWLCAAFGFTMRWQAGEHRAQLAVGDSAIAFRSGEPQINGEPLMVRVDDVAQHRANAERHGGEVGEVGEYPYGERQYVACDYIGRGWVFTEFRANVEPASWGATQP